MNTLRGARRTSALAHAAAAVGFAALAASAPAEVERYIEHLHTSGGQSLGVAIANGHAYALAGVHLLTIDLADPANSAVVDRLLLGENTFSVAAAGDRLYVGAGRRLIVADIAQPGPPNVIAEIALPGIPERMAADGDQLVARIIPGSGLTLFDLADPTIPVITPLPVGMGVRSVVIDGPRILLSGGFSSENVGGVRVFGPGREGALEVLGQVEVPESFDVSTLALDGTRLYTSRGRNAEAFDRLVVFDIQSLQQPVELGGLDIPGEISAIVAAGDDHVLLGVRQPSGLWDNHPKRVYVVDVSNPAAPAIVFSDPVGGGVEAIAAADGLAVAVSRYGGSISVYDIASPAATTRVARLQELGGISYSAHNGSRAYWVNYGSGIVLVDLADPASPRVTHSLPLSGFPVYASSSGSLLAVADAAGNTVQFVDVWAPAGPALLAVAPLSHVPAYLAISGNRLYVGAYDFESIPSAPEARVLHTYDISNLAAPVELGQFSTTGDAPFPVPSGSTVFVVSHVRGAALETHVQVVNLSQPASPVVLHEWSVPGVPNLPQLHGNRLFLPLFDGPPNPALLIYDVANPADPRLLSRIERPDTDLMITAVHENTVFATFHRFAQGNTAELVTYSLHGAALPQQWGYLRHPNIHIYTSLTGTHLFSGTVEGGISVFRLTRPTASASSLVAY